jgi:hypothetical protein
LRLNNLVSFEKCLSSANRKQNIRGKRNRPCRGKNLIWKRQNVHEAVLFEKATRIRFGLTYKGGLHRVGPTPRRFSNVER